METGGQTRKRRKSVKNRDLHEITKSIPVTDFSDVEMERRETIRANLEAAAARKNEISPEAADLLQRLSDLSFSNDPMHS